jgi:hypothetical protein
LRDHLQRALQVAERLTEGYGTAWFQVLMERFEARDSPWLHEIG